MTVIALVMAPMPAGARSAPQANSTKGSTELIAAIPATRSHTAGVKRARACHRKGIRMSAPSANRTSTSAKGPKSAAATRMKRNEPPQTAPSSVSSTGVRQLAVSAGCVAALAGAETGLAERAGVMSDADMTVTSSVAPPRRGSIQRLAKVLEQILGRLDPDREAQKPVGDTEAQPFLTCESGVRSGRRAREQRLHAAKARRDGRDAHTMRELLGVTLAAAELETQHSAVAGKQPARARMPRMRFEAGIVHPCDRRVRREELRNALGAVVLVAHPQRERLQSALEQERRVWIERAAEVIGAVADALDGGGVAHHRAGDDVGVPVQVLGRTVQAQIEARGERPVIDGRCRCCR